MIPELEEHVYLCFLAAGYMRNQDFDSMQKIIVVEQQIRWCRLEFSGIN